ncbi:GGDEF domain-containing protein [Shewanella sp.]|uniref:GGDEF domain-containing protein n=1 Tax=Shewanella sp. TaxID=50422 RepID=UPI0035613216
MDAYTLHIATALSSAIMTFSLLGLYVVSPREYSLLHWSFAGMCFFATNLFAVVSFHFAMPFWILPGLANVLYFGGHFAFLTGVRRYFGLKTPWQLGLGLLILIAVLHVFPYLQASVNNRMLALLPLLMTLNLYTLMLLMQHGRGELRLACLPLILLEFFFFLQLAVRTLIVGLGGDLNLTLAGNEFYQTFGTLAILLFLSLGTMACALMVFRRQELALRLLTTTDPLTGWLNRRALNDIAAREFERSVRTEAPLGVLVLDVDHFKKINDTYGHACGDKALKHVSATCEQLLRGYDYRFRYGGEEFVILLPGCSMKATQALASRLQLKLKQSIVVLDGDSLRVTVSIGLAQRDETDQAWMHVFERADAAMYHAKQNGRDMVACHDGEQVRCHLVSVRTEVDAAVAV